LVAPAWRSVACDSLPTFPSVVVAASPIFFIACSVSFYLAMIF
jgi:hypothetical protein